MTSISKRLGKINSVEFGFGGYQEIQIGISFKLGGESWGVGDFSGHWADWSERCKWTIEDQVQYLGEVTLEIRDLLKDANVSNVSDLKGIPVEVTFEGNALKEWRILKEVL